MHHVAIMKKSWGLTEKILSGEKKIESRWYRTKHIPWDRIRANDTVFFKNSGEPVTIRAEVACILQFIDLNPGKVQEILDEYGNGDGISKDQVPFFFELFKSKKYCILVFLKGVQKIEPFQIDKTGFGMQAAWIMVEDIEQIKLQADR